MANGILGKRAPDVLNPASEVKAEIDFCSEDGEWQKETYHFAEWLGDHLRSESANARSARSRGWVDPVTSA